MENSQLFLLHEKERKEKRKKTCLCNIRNDGLCKAPNHFFCMKKKEQKKGKKPVQGKIRRCKGLMKTLIFLLQCPI